MEQKKLSNQKLAERLKKRKEEKEQRAMTSENKMTPSELTALAIGDSASNGSGDSRSNKQELDLDRDVVNVAKLCWELLTHSRYLTMSSAQYQFVYSVLSRRATKLLTTGK